MEPNGSTVTTWAGKKPSEAELQSILAAHNAWLVNPQSPGESTPAPHNLSKADLSGAKLNQANLSGANLSGANLCFAELKEANLNQANLSEAQLARADLTKAQLFECDLRKADLMEADLTETLPMGAKIKDAFLPGAVINGAQLQKVDLRGSTLTRASLGNAFLYSADLRGTTLWEADLSEAAVTAVKYDRDTKFLGSRYATAYGSPKFLAFARHQEFLEELRQTPRGEKLYQVWDCFADCGRTPWRWIGWSLGFCVFFAVLYCMLLTCNPNAFDITHNTGSTFFTMLYFSVVTFTTLGFGDVAPATSVAQFFVMTEVVIGYAMLGGLISIFATLITRRS